jgi:hypothetical protein
MDSTPFMANKSLHVLHTDRRKTKREKSEAAFMDVLAAVPGVLWKAINNSKTSLILHEFSQLIHCCFFIPVLGLVRMMLSENRQPARQCFSYPYVFGRPGSVSQRYGSGSFYHKAKIVRKTLIPTVL